MQSAMPPVIEFLCPNGDRIRCQAEHAGRAAKCPRCGVAFRVPAAVDLETPGPSGENSGISHPTFTDPGIASHAPPPMGGATQPEPEIDFDDLLAPSPSPLPAAADRPEPSTAAIFSRLWQARRDGATIELRLRDGETVVPDQFLEKQSQAAHGVFAVREPDGSTSLTVVAWESVVRATLRGLRELPCELTD